MTHTNPVKPPWKLCNSPSEACVPNQLGAGITEKKQGRFGAATSMPQLTEAITKAAYDPRVKGIYLKLSRLDAGWAKLQELARYLRFFRCGSPCIAERLLPFISQVSTLEVSLYLQIVTYKRRRKQGRRTAPPPGCLLVVLARVRSVTGHASS